MTNANFRTELSHSMPPDIEGSSIFSDTINRSLPRNIENKMFGTFQDRRSFLALRNVSLVVEVSDLSLVLLETFDMSTLLSHFLLAG